MKQLNRKMSIGVWISVLVITILLVSVTVTFAGGIALPNTFSPGTTISSSQVNANFQALNNALPAFSSSYQQFGSFGIGVSLPTGISAITPISFTPPANGYVIIFATAQIVINNGAAQSNTEVQMNICSTPNVNSSNVRIDGIPATTSWHSPLSLMDVEAVSPTPTTLYLNGFFSGPSGSSANITSLQVTMIFVPSAF